MKQPTVAPKTHRIEKTHLSHILPVLGQKFISDIEPDDISRYQQHRLREKAAPKTVNLEVGTVRAILRRHRLWANVQPDVRMLSVREDVGKALAVADEKRLLDGCADSRSRSLLPAVLLALNTGMRYSELRLLRWEQIDLDRRTVRVGKSKTEAGTGRVIPLNDKASKVLKFWADQFPDRKPAHFAFPSERYGAGGDDFEPTVFDVDPETPNRFVEGGVGVREASHGRCSSVPRPAPHLRYPHARRRRAAVGRGFNLGLEPSYDRADGEAVRAYRAGGSAPGRGGA
jgi:integrase